MLRSTVTTGSYILEKYSRSYPSSAFAQTHSQSLPASQPEWQHFTNPIITLTLDVKKSMVNNFESVRLRILWDMNAGHNGTQREIVMVRAERPHICAIRLEGYPISGRPRSLVVFWSRFPSSLYARSAPQSCLSGHGSRNPLPVSPHCAGHLSSRTHNTDFFHLFSSTACLLMTNCI